MERGILNSDTPGVEKLQAHCGIIQTNKWGRILKKLPRPCWVWPYDATAVLDSKTVGDGVCVLG
jgi:hypothetical protein